MDATQRQTIVDQIGRNIWAICGGPRRVRPIENGIAMPVGKSYWVRVELDANDTYTVTRVFIRGGKQFGHGERTDVYCDQVGAVAYYASCYASHGDSEWTEAA